jgi:hypothetical protein
MQALPLPDLVHQFLRRVLAEKDKHVVVKIGPISCTTPLQASKSPNTRTKAMQCVFVLHAYDTGAKRYK